MKDGDGAYLANILMEGGQSEHEEETGRLRLYEHAFNKDLVIAEVCESPFRELWMRDGHADLRPPDPARDGLIPPAVADPVFVVFNPRSGRGGGRAW